MTKADVMVIGAGIIGLSVAFEVIVSGGTVVIIDRDPEGDKVSFGNAGGIAVTELMPASTPGLWRKIPGWMLDPLGPLSVRPRHAARLLPWLCNFLGMSNLSEVGRISEALSDLNSRTYADLMPLFSRVGLTGELICRGALTVYESAKTLRNDRPIWDIKRALGIDARELCAAEARAMEPALGPIVQGGVFTPQWSHVSDPKKVVDVLRNWLVANGARIVQADVSQVQSTPYGAIARFDNGRTFPPARW